MAVFLIAYKKTSISEGDYSNHPDDTGGETWKGVARKKNPQWDGFKIIDAYRSHKKFPGILKNIPELESKVQQLYKTEYWDKIRGDEIKDQTIADSLYDSAVNMGPKPAIKLAQRAIGADETGVMDDKTIKLINQ